MTRYHRGMRFVVFALLLVCGCPHGATGPRPDHDPTVADVVARLDKARAELVAFKADATMDYWLGNDRVKGEVLLMGKAGARVRFAALSPAGGSSLAEMSCDGTNFKYVDYDHNCALSGPCTKGSIAQFFRIELEPDDFLHLALGTPPLIAGATGTVTWDAGCGCWKVELHGAGAAEKLTIDAKDQRWDVIDAELLDGAGKTVWRVANKDFVELADGSGGKHRVPGKSTFKSPAQQQDLLVDWGAVDDRAVNPTIDDAKFGITIPDGLARCNGQAPQGNPPAPAGAGAPTR